MAEEHPPKGIPQLRYYMVNSSNIYSVDYFGPAREDLLVGKADGVSPFMQLSVHPAAKTGTFCVFFRNGTLYHFDGVPAEVVTEVVTAPSIGKAFNALIRGHKEFHGAKIDPATGLPIPKEAHPENA